MSAAKRRFAPLGGRQLHYRRLGSGPALIMLPPLPAAGGSVLPLATLLSNRYDVFIVDPPGYGLSGSLSGLAGEDLLLTCRTAIFNLLKHLEIERFGLIGQGVGAVLALDLAASAGDRVAGLALDFGTALALGADLDPDTQFPSVTPRRDGGHLLTHWDMARSSFLFAPWNAQTVSSRLGRPPPAPDRIHDRALDTLRAGDGYARTLRAARDVDIAALISAQTLSPLIIRRPDERNRPELATLVGALRTQTYRVGDVGDTVEETAICLFDHFEGLNGSLAARPAQRAQIEAEAAGFQSLFIDIPGGQMLARACLHGNDGAPLVGLHDPAGSSNRVLGVLTPFLRSRPVIAFDLPGAGESDPLVRAGVTIEQYADWTAQALDSLGIEGCDILGRYSGGQVGLELSLAREKMVRSVIHYGIQIFEAAERSSLLENYAPSLAPTWDGAHLATAWALLRDMSLFWPWFNRTASGTVWRDAAIDAASIHARVVDLLKAGEAWRYAYAASFNYPMQARMAVASAPNLFVDTPGSASYPRLITALASARNGRARDLTGPPSEWTIVFENFLNAER